MTTTRRDLPTAREFVGNSKASAAIELSEAERFLMALDPSAKVYHFQWFGDTDAAKETHKAGHRSGSFENLADMLQSWNDRAHGIFVVVNETDGKGRATENITRVRAVFADFDGAPLPTEWPLYPHLIAETSPGRFHAYWFVDGLPLDKFKLVQLAVALWFGSDSKVCDLSRVMRLPGFLHRKGEPFMSRIVEMHDHPRFTANEIMAAFPPAEMKRITPSAITNGKVNRYVRGALDKACEKIAFAPEGSRNQTLNSEAFSIFGFVPHEIAEHEVYTGLYAAAQAAGLGDAEIRDTLKSASKGMGSPRHVPSTGEAITHRAKTTIENFTELEAANLLREQHGENIRHHDGFGWLCWDGMRWQLNEKAVRRYVHDLGAVVRRMAGDVQDPDTFAAFGKFAKKLESASGIDNVLKIAESLEGIDANAIEFDTHPWLLNCTNGTIDLRTGALRNHDRRDYLTKCCPTAYNPAAECPTWRRTLDGVFCGNNDLIRYFQILMGYSLTGATHWQTFTIMYGTGENGKTTILVTFQNVMGRDYAQQLDAEELMLQTHARHTTERAALRGARMVVTIETSEGRRLNEAFVKALTGGDAMRARFMRKDSFEFIPELKLFVGTNHKPVIRDTSGGMWRRIRLIPFEAKFRGADRDPHLGAKLQAEAAGILAWAVEGARAAVDGEPQVPECVRAASETYRHDEDTIGKFIAECCEVGNPYFTVKVGDLRAAFESWNGGRGPSAKAFTQAILERGFKDKRAGHGRMFTGISLIANDLQNPVTDSDRTSASPRGNEVSRDYTDQPSLSVTKPTEEWVF